MAVEDTEKHPRKGKPPWGMQDEDEDATATITVVVSHKPVSGLIYFIICTILSPLDYIAKRLDCASKNHDIVLWCF